MRKQYGWCTSLVTTDIEMIRMGGEKKRQSLGV